MADAADADGPASGAVAPETGSRAWPTARDPAQESLSAARLALRQGAAAVVIGAVIVASLLRAFVGQMFIIPSVSMENTLKVADRVVVEKLTLDQARPGRGLRGPRRLAGRRDRTRTRAGRPGPGVRRRAARHQHRAPDQAGRSGCPAITSSAAMPKAGSRSTAYRWTRPSYLYPLPDGDRSDPSEIRFDVVVPADRIFVLGDNRERQPRLALPPQRRAGRRGQG